MDISLGIFIGFALSFGLWRWEVSNKSRKETGFFLYTDFLKICNQGNEAEAEKAWSRYLDFYARTGWNAAAIHPDFESRVEEACRIAKAVGDQRTKRSF